MTAPGSLSVLLPLAIGGLALSGCDRPETAPPPPIRPALTMVVQPAGQVSDRRFTGTVQPRYEARLGFQAPGRMTSRAANVGDRVKVGQTLATLDATVLRFAVVSAKADLANAQAALVNARATNDRQQELLKTGSVSQAQVDAAVASRDTAQAKVNQAQASLAKASEQFGYATLASGYDGVVESWSAEVGQVVSAGQAVVTIARPDVRDAVFDVSDDRLDRFTVGRDAVVALLADPAVTAHASVREVSPQSDAMTRTRRVRLSLVDAPTSFRLGTTITTALVETEPRQPRIALPAAAVVEREGTSHVWIVGADGRLSARAVTLESPEQGCLGKPQEPCPMSRGRPAEQPVTTDAILPSHGPVTVASGLVPGDRVLIAGAHSVSEGQLVRPASP